MAIFKELPNDLIHQFEELETNAEEMMGEMTKAGAEVVYNNIRKNLGMAFKGEVKSKMEQGLKITRTYKSPKKDTIGNFVGFYGYIPFSDPYRKLFKRKGAGGDTYETDKGVPREFLANVYEYGSSNGISATRFIKKSSSKEQVEEAMQQKMNEFVEGE